jgi:hypothetical protein
MRFVSPSADGVANHRVARELHAGRKPRLTTEKEEAIVHATLYSKPIGATYWSVRTLAPWPSG